MEHGKLEASYSDESKILRLLYKEQDKDSVVLAVFGKPTQTECSVINRLITCWEEHDTLIASRCVCNGALDEDEGGIAYCRIAVKLSESEAKAELVDELMTELKECVGWIKTDISYKAPEQLQEMASERWLPKIMSTCESLLKKAEGK